MKIMFYMFALLSFVGVLIPPHDYRDVLCAVGTVCWFGLARDLS